MTGEDNNNYFGHDIELADFNDDGHVDMAITALGYNSSQGRVYIYWGSDRKSIDTKPDKYLTGEDGVPMFGGDNVDCGG